MPAVPEDVMTNEQTAPVAAEAAPEPAAQASIPVAVEANGTALPPCLLPRPWLLPLRLPPRAMKNR